MKYGSAVFLIVNLCAIHANSHTAQKADDSNPFLDIATSFLQETLANQQNGHGARDSGGNAGIAGIAQIVGSLMQQDPGSKSNVRRNFF